MNLIYKYFSIFIIVILTSCDTQHKPLTVSKNISLSDTIHFQFDKNNAWDYLTKQTSFGARNPNSIGHQRCMHFLYNELLKHADKVDLIPFQQKGYDENLYLTNIFASFKPELKYRILLLAHWDTRPRADNDRNPQKQNLPIIGANDGASGVAVLLEVARILKLYSSSIGVDILLVDGEDYGKRSELEYFSLGAKYFANNKPATYHPKFGILLDMIGDKNLQLYPEINSTKYAPAFCNEIWKRARMLNLQQFQNEPKYEVYDDHIVLNQSGIPTVDIIDFDYEYWHTSEDTPDKCSKESLEAVGKLILNIIYDPPDFL